MKFPALPSIAAALFCLLSCAARAAEEPEAVYARFYRAVASGDLEEMLRHGPEARRAKIASMSAEDRNAALRIMRKLMPREYRLRNKTVDSGGRGARLIMSGPGDSNPGGKPQTLYGTITMVMEREEWKVDQVSWSNEPPETLAPVRPAGAPPAQKAALGATPGATPRTAPETRPAPVAGTASSAPERRLGTAKEPCVYKPVMTDEDIENCK